MKLHDFNRHAHLGIVGTGDVGVLRGNANRPQLAITAFHRLGSARRFRHHETAASELQVGEFDNIGRCFDKGVLSADAAIGSAQGHEHRRIGRTYEQILHVAVAQHQGAPRIRQARYIQAGSFERSNSIIFQRALRHGNAQGTRCLGRLQRRHYLLQVECEACSGNLFGAVLGKQVVVATAATQRRAQAGSICFEHQARVIVKRTHYREIDKDLALQARFDQRVVHAFQLADAASTAQRFEHCTHLRKLGLSATQAGKREDGTGNGGNHTAGIGDGRVGQLEAGFVLRFVRATIGGALGSGNKFLQIHEIRGVVRLHNGSLPLIRSTAGIKQIAQNARRTQGDGKCFQTAFGKGGS